MTLTTLQLSNSDRHIAFRDHGSGDPLVLLHGVGMQSASWGPQIAAFAPKYRVIALDLPGHGDSDPLPVGSLLPDFVDWCHQAITALNIGPVNLVGHSMGALIAGGYAATHGDMVRRVALLNCVYKRGADARDAVIARAEQIQSGQIDLATPLDRWFGQSHADQLARAQVSNWLGTVDIDGYATAYSAFAQGDATYAEKLQEIACPFLALTADGDLNSSPDMSAAMAGKVRNGLAVTVKNHRHMVNLTAPDQVNSHLSVWITRPEFAKEIQ